MATLELIAFALFALLTVGSSLGVVLVEDVWHSALFLGAALLSVAIHYVMLRAEFIAAMQVLVYVGGVLILITFAVMLTRQQLPMHRDRPTAATDGGTAPTNGGTAPTDGGTASTGDGAASSDDPTATNPGAAGSSDDATAAHREGDR